MTTEKSLSGSAKASELDYFQLLQESRVGVPGGGRTIKLAILADFASQPLVPLLKAQCARRGVQLEIYEAPYDAIDSEVLAEESGLYSFAPDAVAIMMASQKLKDRIYVETDRRGCADRVVERITGLWSTLLRRLPVTIIQTTFVVPSERAFGGYELSVEHSVGAITMAANTLLVDNARRTKGVLLCDLDHVAAEVGRSHWYDDRLWYLAKALCRLEHLPRVTRSLVQMLMAAQGTFVKCVILDLDNTLWGGVIADDGLEGIQLGGYDEGEAYVSLQKFLLELKRRGIVLAVVSKNDHANAVLPFRQHPSMVLKEDDVAVFMANWDSKIDNIRSVQQTLNIGFDSMVFLDDNPVERDMIRTFLPDVIVPELPEDPSLYLRALTDLSLFETTSYSATDEVRVQRYREQTQREQARHAFTDLDSYLASLEMTQIIQRFQADDIPRIAQLMQRSNQFNLTTRRYSQATCEALMSDPSCVPFTMKLADKFGDYGLIGAGVLRLQGDVVAIDEFLMSCRALQRGVEQLAMNSIVQLARRLGANAVTGEYLKTSKNGMVKDFYSRFGFLKLTESSAGDSLWELAVDEYAPIATHATAAIVEL